MIAHARRDHTGRITHTSLEVPVPRWVWALARRAGVKRSPLEVSADQVRACRAESTGASFDYWGATEAPRT